MARDLLFFIISISLLWACKSKETTRSAEYTEDGSIVLHEIWDNESADWFNQVGFGTIKGRAVLTMKDGTQRNCAGLGIELLPVTKYAEERMSHIYAESTHGAILVADRKPPTFHPDEKSYHEFARKTTCSDEGLFRFEHLPAGEYYIIAFILWDEVQIDMRKELQGGGLMKRVLLTEGASLEVELENGT